MFLNFDIESSIFTTSAKSAQVTDKNASFTKVYKRKELSPKAESKGESPLLLAFKKQGKICSKKEAVETIKKQERVKTIMEFMGIKTKQTQDMPKNNRR